MTRLEKTRQHVMMFKFQISENLSGRSLWLHFFNQLNCLYHFHKKTNCFSFFANSQINYSWNLDKNRCLRKQTGVSLATIRFLLRNSLPAAILNRSFSRGYQKIHPDIKLSRRIIRDFRLSQPVSHAHSNWQYDIRMVWMHHFLILWVEFHSFFLKAVQTGFDDTTYSAHPGIRYLFYCCTKNT